MNIEREKRRCLPMHGLAYFSDSQSSSSATTENKTDIRDMRVVGGEKSNNISANDSNINLSVTATDFGAVQGGLNTAGQAFALSTQLVGDNTRQNLNAGLSMFDGAIKSQTGMFGTAIAAIKDANSNALERAGKSNDSALAAVSSARSDVAAAWQDSHTPENSMLKIAGFVVVGIAAVGLIAMKK